MQAAHQHSAISSPFSSDRRTGSTRIVSNRTRLSRRAIATLLSISSTRGFYRDTSSDAARQRVFTRLMVHSYKQQVIVTEDAGTRERSERCGPGRWRRCGRAASR